MNKSKFPIVLFLAVSALFVSCEKDSEDVTEEEQKEITDQERILGEWQLTDLVIENGRTVTVFDGQSVTTNYTSYGKDFDMTITINEDPKTVVSDGSYTSVITATVLGIANTQEVPISTPPIQGEWYFTDEGIVFVEANDEENLAIIKELTDTKLVLEMDYNVVIPDEQNNATSTSTGDITLTLEK